MKNKIFERDFSSIKSGSITVYLCLVFFIILALVFACIDSARYVSGRAALYIAADESMFSLFSNYDRTLYESYGLLFLDAGYQTGELQIGKAAAEALQYLEEIISPTLLSAATTPKELFRIETELPEVTGYVLATDSNYSPIVSQMTLAVLAKLGADGLDELEETLTLYADAVEEFSLESEDELDELTERYEEQKELAERLKEEAEEAGYEEAETAVADMEETEVEIPEDFVNPIEVISPLRQLGILAIALPDATSLSSGSVDTDELPSGRTLNKGLGLVIEEESAVLKKLTVSEYALNYFPNYTTDNADMDSDELKYQVEYILCGGSSDVENLRSVMTRLLLMREGLNYVYLLSDTEKNTEIYSIATTICSILLFPAGIELVAQLVRLCWAFAESVLDIKSLLDGGKVPIFKDASSWQTSLLTLTTISSDTQAENKDRGLSYEDYLRIFMYLSSEDELTERTADMLEYNKRIKDDAPDFRLDSCIYSLQLEFVGSIGGYDVSVSGSYSYD